MSNPSQSPSIGRIIHYVLRDGRRAGEVRAAIVTNAFPSAEDGICNGTVFLDELNDSESERYFGSAKYDETNIHGTWHWPPRV